MTITYLPDELWSLIKAFQITKYFRADDKVWNLIKEFADVTPPTCCRQDVRRYAPAWGSPLLNAPCFRRCATTQDPNGEWRGGNGEYFLKGWHTPSGTGKYYPLCEVCLAIDFDGCGDEEEILKEWVRGSASHRELEGPNTEETGETILWKGKN